MKKIGFVDFYLSEWHANNYPSWMKDACAKLGADYSLEYAWAERDVSLLDGVTSDEWCNKFGAKKCETLEELCEKSDFIVVLAPSNPEKHLTYAETVLRYGKRTYIDKTFAPDLKTAKKIFELGKKYNTPFFSSSALRYASELSEIKAPTRVEITGGGSNPEEYIIHQIEMLVKCLGTGSDNLTLKKDGDKILATVSYPDERVGTLTFAPELPFTVTATEKDGKTVEKNIDSPFFNSLIEDIIRFFGDGELSFASEETLEVMKLREKFVAAL